MIRDLLFGLGLVAVIEGLVLALLPMRLEDMLTALARLSGEQRRLCGLLAVTGGVAIAWLAHV